MSRESALRIKMHTQQRWMEGRIDTLEREAAANAKAWADASLEWATLVEKLEKELQELRNPRVRAECRDADERAEYAEEKARRWKE
jgi:hypothetical protein